MAGARQRRRLMSGLEDRFHFIAVNLFGYGRTPAWTNQRSQTLEDQAGLVEAALPRTTLGYGEWSPDYLANATAALDDWIIRLQTRTKRVLLSLQPRTKDVLIPKNKRKLNASGTNTERPQNVIALK